MSPSVNAITTTRIVDVLMDAAIDARTDQRNTPGSDWWDRNATNLLDSSDGPWIDFDAPATAMVWASDTLRGLSDTDAGPWRNAGERRTFLTYATAFDTLTDMAMARSVAAN